MRFPIPHATSISMAILFIVVASFATFGSVQHPSRQQAPAELPAGETAAADVTSLMQGKVRVIEPRDFVTVEEARKKEISILAKDVSETSSIMTKAMSSQPKDSKQTPYGFSQEDDGTKVASRRSTPPSAHASETASLSFLNLAALQIKHVLAEGTDLRSSGGAFAAFSIFFIVFIIAVCYCILRSSYENSARNQDTSPSKDPALVMEQRDRMLSHTSLYMPGGMYQRPSGTAQSSVVSLGAGVPSAPFLVADAARSGTLMPAPRTISETGGQSPRLSYMEHQQMMSRQSVKPPALCPTLVMPMSEALLGIQMYELAQLGAEGELNIVGISGKPLLRAAVKKVGDTRTLEIAMPEQNSIPRATISPASASFSSQAAAAGTRVLAIRGMRGDHYGTLEMRSSGACYVVKDGQTVLTIDGDAESLQLALKSSVGLQLASVRCSTELFDGVDHVEIRVEPGVDTVLVISVVLAVLLLSPYLADTS